MGARCPAQGTAHTYGRMLGRGETSDGRVVVEDETKKEETTDETMCTEHLTDSVGEVVDLVDAEGNMLMGEVTVSLLPLAVTYGARCW